VLTVSLFISKHMRIHLASDHAGFILKEHLKEFLKGRGYDIIDYGAATYQEEDDYPDYVQPAAEAVGKEVCAGGDDVRGIVIGGSGQGEAIVANRVAGVRAVVWYGGNKRVIGLSREHNDANILSIGARFVDDILAEEMVVAWLETPFSGDKRHMRRICKIDTEEKSEG